MTRQLRVGIVGLQPGRSWAALAHMPGLRAQPEDFIVVGVANRSHESACAAAAACGIPKAFVSVEELLTSSDIDMVSVTVRVPHHRAVLEQAIATGKPIYCEWPLARDVREAERLVRLADEYGVRTCIGTQALANFQLRHVRDLLRANVMGRVLSHTIIGYGRLAGAEITDESTELYLLDRTSGADMLSIAVGHTLAALQWVGGDVTAISSAVTTRRTAVFSQQRQNYVPMTAPDQVALHGYLADGSLFSLHYRGGMPPDGRGLLWEIEGTAGVCRISAASGCIQIENCSIELCLNGETRFRRVDVPAGADVISMEDFVPGNVGRMYAMFRRDVLFGGSEAPDFRAALALHRLLDVVESTSLPNPVEVDNE